MCIWGDDLWNNLMYDERLPLPGLKPETPAGMKRTLTAMPQTHA